LTTFSSLSLVTHTTGMTHLKAYFVHIHTYIHTHNIYIYIYIYYKEI